jgi:hypothetical protein
METPGLPAPAAADEAAAGSVEMKKVVVVVAPSITNALFSALFPGLVVIERST